MLWRGLGTSLGLGYIAHIFEELGADSHLCEGAARCWEGSGW